MWADIFSWSPGIAQHSEGAAPQDVGVPSAGLDKCLSGGPVDGSCGHRDARGVGSPHSPGDSQESSPTTQFKSINSSALSFLYSPTLTSIHDYWKSNVRRGPAPPQDPGKPEGETALVIDLERDKERMLKTRK